MNKYIIFALLFVFVLNKELEDYIYTGENADKCLEVDEASVDNCNKITFSDDDYKCCYYSVEVDGKKVDEECYPLKKSEVKDMIDDFEDAADDEGYSADVSIDCSSNYISNALLILLSLLF